MEVANKFLNVGNRPASLKPNAWYSLTPMGDVPTLRVGHTATYVAGEQVVIFIGGAVPDGLCDDTWILYLSDLTCSKVIAKGDFEQRYEHYAFNVTSQVCPIGENVGTRLWVFAGADMEGNKNDIWEFDVEDLKWSRVITKGDAPSKRTLHSNVGPVSRLMVFGGGARGAEAVDDSNVYQLDIKDREWSILETSGEPPAPRHGHIILTNADGKTYIHGGLSGKTFFNDLFVLDNNKTWTKPSVSDIKPKGRASHGGLFHNNRLYILGGLTAEGVVNDFWRIDTKNYIWEQIAVQSHTFPARLDFAMTLVELPGKFLRRSSAADNGLEEINSVEEFLNVNSNSRQAVNEEDRNRELLPFIMIHGGMDDKGMIYADFFVFKLPVD